MISVDRHYCKGCGLCVAVCPVKALQLGAERNHMGYHTPLADNDLCKLCKACELICPDVAIWLEQNREEGTHA